MSYASLSEVWGADFAHRMNPVSTQNPSQNQYVENSMNPTRNNNTLPGDRSKTARYRAERRSLKDRKAHKESFTDVSGVRNKMAQSEFRPWGDEEDIYDQENSISPREYLERSLAGNGNIRRSRSGYPPDSVGEARVNQKSINPTDYLVSKRSGDVVYAPFNASGSQSLEPVGYGGPITTYGGTDRSPCKDYFYHLDTCRKCQRKLKRRVARYFRSLQRNKRNPLLPGVQGMTPSLDRELFSDYDDLDEMMMIEEKKARSDQVQNNRGELCLSPPSENIPSKNPDNEDVQAAEKVQEGFVDLGHDYTPGIFLILFGLFVIYSLDTSRKIFSGGGIKIIK